EHHGGDAVADRAGDCSAGFCDAAGDRSDDQDTRCADGSGPQPANPCDLVDASALAGGMEVVGLLAATTTGRGASGFVSGRKFRKTAKESGCVLFGLVHSDFFALFHVS